MAIVNIDKTYTGKDGRLYYKQENLLKELSRIGIKMLIIWIGLMITHELGHISGATLFNLKWEIFFLEPAIYRDIDGGIAVGILRDRSFILWEELYCRIGGTIIFNLLWLISLRILRKSMFEPARWWFWIPFIFILLSGDILMLISDIEHNTVVWTR